MKIIPAILEKNFEEVQKKVAVMEGIADQLQIDIVDGKYVEGLTFLEIEKINELNTWVNIELDLFVENPVEYITLEIRNVNRVCTHVEKLTETEITEFIETAKSKGFEVGLSIEPETRTEEILPYLNKIDYVQFMTIHPGAQGNPFIPEVLEKIRDFTQKYPTVICQADGSIGMENLKSISEAGITRVAVGSHIFRSQDPVAEFLKLKKVNL